MDSNRIAERLLATATEAFQLALDTKDEQRAEEALRCGLKAAQGYYALVELGRLDTYIQARWN